MNPLPPTQQINPPAGGTVQAESGRHGGFALVLVLSVLVLMLIVTLAFFSKAQLNRQISSASASNQQARLLAQAALENFVWDLRHEIEAGSETDPLPAGSASRNIFLPRAIAATNLTLLGTTSQLSVFPSMLPERIAASTAPALLVKQTLGGSNFFRNKPGVTNGPTLPPIPARASAITTSAQPQVGRPIPVASWSLPGLHDAASESVPEPNWVYVNRTGGTPTEFSSAWSDRQSTNANYIIGRYAYNVYDVGGLLDINVVGNALDESANTLRTRQHQVQLTNGDGDLEMESFADFVQWRSSQENTNSLADPARTFLTVSNQTNQALTGRKDLLTKARKNDSPIPEASARLLHTANRSLIGPAHVHDPRVMTLQPADLNANEINASILGARFASETTLQRGTEDPVTVPPGTPVLFRKFPLPKLDLLSDTDADPADLQYYFGLERQPNGAFRYTAAAPDGRIKRPAEIAAEGREPNFFEILQAVTVTGSLGRNAGNTFTIDHNRDGNRNHQIWQIGANIIDQWDEDDFPTEIQYRNGNGDWESVYGVENLPYINSIAIKGHRPQWDRDRFQVWAVFDLWNPHQQSNVPPSGIRNFRIRARSGQVGVRISYQLSGDTNRRDNWPNPDAIPAPAPNVPGSHVEGTVIDYPPYLDVALLNQNREILIQDYTPPLDGAPFLAGPEGPPNNADWAGGLLLHDRPSVPPAVPPNIENYVGTGTYTSLINYLNIFLRGFNLPAIGEILPDESVGTFGAKAHNTMRIRTPRDNKVVIDLEYFNEEQDRWIPYQSVDGFIPHDNVTLDSGLRGFGSYAGAPVSQSQGSETFLEDTLISVNPNNTEQSYYGWTFDPSPANNPVDEDGISQVTNQGFTVVKFDPRTVRFGHTQLRKVQRGRTIRQSTTLPGYLARANARDHDGRWMALDQRGNFLHADSIYLPLLQPANAIQWFLARNQHYVPFGFMANIPEGSLAQDFNPSRYRDRDGLIRPGDGYLGAIPTAVPVTNDRPEILNRPFRTVGDLGYVFRDLPWKSLDFFTRNSGDLGLLDVFSLEETPGEMPVIAGQVNLNSAPAEVLATLLTGAARSADGTNPFTAAEARDLADDIVAERDEGGPFLHIGDLVARVFSPVAHKVNEDYNQRERKADSEAAIRALSSLTCTRTWNFLMDLVVQSGRFGPGSDSASDFLVTAQKRYWVSLAVDRITGEVISEQWESVDEE